MPPEPMLHLPPEVSYSQITAYIIGCCLFYGLRRLCLSAWHSWLAAGRKYRRTPTVASRYKRMRRPLL